MNHVIIKSFSIRCIKTYKCFLFSLFELQATNKIIQMATKSQPKTPTLKPRSVTVTPAKAIKKVTHVDKELLQKLRTEYQKAFDSVHKENGMVNAAVDIQKITFGNLSFHFKVEVIISGSDSDEDQIMSKDQIQWESKCESYGFKKSDYNSPFKTNNGEDAILKTIKSKNKKYPIIYEIVAIPGSRYKASVAQIKSLLPDYFEKGVQKLQTKHYCTACGHEIKGWFPGCLVHPTCVN